MLSLVSSVPALFFGIALLVSGSFMLGTLLAMRLTVEGFSPGSIGVVMMFYSFGFVTGTRYGVPVIQRVGHIRSFAAFAAITCACFLFYPLFISGPAWVLLRVVNGFSMAGVTIVMESWINGRATNRNRGTLLSIYMVTYYLAAAVGELLIGLGQPGSSPLFNVAAILVVLSLVPVTLTGVAAPSLEQSERLSFRRLYVISPTGLIGALATGVVISAFLSIGPVYAQLRGLNANQLSQYMAVSVVAAMLLQWPAGKLSDLYDRRRVLSGLAALAGLFSLGAALVGDVSVVGLFLFTALFMGVASSLYPISVALINDYMEYDQIVAASSGLLLSYGIGTCFGPLAGSLVMQWYGPHALFLFICLCLALLASYGWYRSLYTPDVPLEDQASHVTVVAPSSPVIAEIDPRNDEFEPKPVVAEETSMAYDAAADETPDEGEVVADAEDVRR